MPKIELDEVEAAYADLLFTTRFRLELEARRDCNRGLEKILKKHGHEWPGSDVQVGLKGSSLAWGDELVELTEQNLVEASKQKREEQDG